MLGLILSASLAKVALQTFFPQVGPFLDARVECTTPVSSFARLKEGVFLYDHGVSPYSGDMCYNSPLLVALFSLVSLKSGFLINCIYAAAEGYAAYCLAGIAKARPKRSFSEDTVAIFYLFNPFSLLSGSARSTNVFTNAATIAALRAAVIGRPIQAMVLLSVAAVLGWYPLYFLVPLLILANSSTYSRFSLAKSLGAFVTSVGILLGLSYLTVQSWNFIPRVYGTQLFLHDLTRPNLGLWWYFFIEMFEFFRPFFFGCFQVFIASFALPLSVRFPDDPLFVISTVAAILATFKPYPEAGDVGFFLSLLSLCSGVVNLMRFKVVVALGLLYVTALSPTFYNLWIYVGSGNANFFYAITLVFSLTVTLCVSDMLWAAVRLDYDGGRGSNLMQL